MIHLGSIAKAASRVAQDEAKEITRVAVLKTLFGALAALFLVVAFAFALVGLYILLEDEVGAVLAAFYVAGGCLLIAAISLLVSIRIRKRTSLGAKKARVDAMANEAAKELESISPYLVLGAFVIGFLRGKK